jgi:hypothetical protein
MTGPNLFEPKLRLIRQPDGRFTLRSLTLTPSGCWQAGPARLATPPNVLLIPEVEPVILELAYRQVFCTQAIKPIRHSIGNIELGPKHGKTAIVAFVMHHDQILGSSSIEPRPGQLDCGPDPSSPILDTSDWFAWVDRMPGPQPPTLFVTGNVTVPTPGYAVRLEVASPQGINPRVLILDLKVEALPGVWPQVVATKQARFELSPYKDTYDSVLVQLPEGAIELDIEEVF